MSRLNYTPRRLNYTPLRLDAAVFCPRCWGPMLYAGADTYRCREHGEAKPADIFDVLGQIKTQNAQESPLPTEGGSK